MTLSPAALTDLLQPGEALLWQGRIGFNITSSPFITLALLALSSYAFATTWGSFSPSEFCPPDGSASKCESFYWMTAPLLGATALLQGFDFLERHALTSGTAQGAILLTNRRLIRVSDWPHRRVRSFDYLTTRPRRGIGGVIRFGTLNGSVILAPDDAATVRALMRATRKGPA